MLLDQASNQPHQSNVVLAVEPTSYTSGRPGALGCLTTIQGHE